MKIKWYGHSCFLLTNEDGVRILTDPCDPTTGYTLSGIGTDVVTLSHDHFDHNYVQAAAGAPHVIRTAGVHAFSGIRIEGVPTWHDAVRGAKRGANLVYLFDMDGMRTAHLGDLGEVPDDETFARFGRVDVLLCPVGGHFTIDAAQAHAIADRLRPRVLIPMHYKTPAVGFPIAGVDRLLADAQDNRIHRLNEDECTITRDTLGDDRILVLDYAR